MQNRYSDQLIKLLEPARLELAPRYQFEIKNVFGAVGGYVAGRIFVVCGKFGVGLKLPPETRLALFQNKTAAQFRYFPNGHIKKEYALLAQPVLYDRLVLSKLINESIQYVLAAREPQR